ncbi:unnamed protein product [Caenorhabditis angaria]|uniref:CUB domain-containing protein n=1 Tax=Caenorhabditis angaria TaxID=860376 RepID=A0A9P1N7N0_9PELO|nr:unnamed protein product [Caenorhabditis angaria]
MLLPFSMIFLIISIKICEADVICNKNMARFGTNITEESFREAGAESCEYIFVPKLNESVVLSDIPCYYDMEVWLIFVDEQEDSKENEIYLDEFTTSRCSFYNYRYESPKSTGIRVKFYNPEGYGIRFDFSRNENPKNRKCDFPIQNLTANQTIVLKKPEQSETCVYRLIPPQNSEDFNEILIETSSDYKISEHDENGTISKEVQFVGTKFFATQVLDIYLSKSSRYDSGKLKTSLVHKSCDCGAENISTNSTLTTIRSPGFPKANCHHRKCTYFLSFEPSDNPNTVLLFNFVTNFDVKDRLIAGDNVRNRDINFHSKYLPRTFFLTSRNLNVTYKASSTIADRSFEINITKIDILEKCRCPSFFDKYYNDLRGKIELKIPKSCRNIFCHWIIENDQRKTTILTDRSSQKPRVVFEIEFENPHINDALIFNHNSINHRIQKSDIYSTNNFPVNIDFQRLEMNISTETHIKITWKFTLDCSCPTPPIKIFENQSIILTSPNYPDKYCENMNCQINLKSENGTQIEIFIEKSELENFHDYLRIDKNVIELTGTYRNYTILTGKNEVDLRFESDSNEEELGFFIILRARKMEEESQGFFKILTFLMFFVILILFGFGFLKNRDLFLTNAKDIDVSSYQSYAVQ